MAKTATYQYVVAGFLLAALVFAVAGRPATAVAQEDEYLIFLPLTASAPTTALAIANGDFESGRTVWCESSTWDNVLIVAADGLPRGIAPHGGSWAAWLGGDNNETAAIAQPVTVDPNFPYLAFWLWIDWPFSCQGSSAAVATVTLGQTVLYESDVCEETDTGGWIQQLLDTSAFAGQTATLRFQLITESNSFANLYLDDVAFQSSP